MVLKSNQGWTWLKWYPKLETQGTKTKQRKRRQKQPQWNQNHANIWINMKICMLYTSYFKFGFHSSWQYINNILLILLFIYRCVTLFLCSSSWFQSRNSQEHKEQLHDAFCIFRKYTFENINIFLDLFLYFKVNSNICRNKEYSIK